MTTRLRGCSALDGGPRGGLAGEGMKAADEVLESALAGFGALNPTAAYLAAAPLGAEKSLLLYTIVGIKHSCSSNRRQVLQLQH